MAVLQGYFFPSWFYILLHPPRCSLQHIFSYTSGVCLSRRLDEKPPYGLGYSYGDRHGRCAVENEVEGGSIPCRILDGYLVRAKLALCAFSLDLAAFFASFFVMGLLLLKYPDGSHFCLFLDGTAVLGCVATGLVLVCAGCISMVFQYNARTRFPRLVGFLPPQCTLRDYAGVPMARAVIRPRRRLLRGNHPPLPRRQH
ncbi:hypothetical protein BJ912DRAFT_967688 [Pholiota molesta]|nr:hypothetical protein BJ912DRAFT_967688 [Pholiota molesta]